MAGKTAIVAMALVAVLLILLIVFNKNPASKPIGMPKMLPAVHPVSILQLSANAQKAPVAAQQIIVINTINIFR